MSSRARTIAGASLVAVLAFGACTVKDHPDEPNAAAGTSAAGSQGGRSGSSSTQAGSSSKAGRGGTNSQGGTSSTNGGAGEATGATGGDAAGAGGAPACPGCDSGFCLDDGTCVDCLASNDHCPASQYCTDAHECVAGCKTDGSSCASGICDEQHNCSNCIDDGECVGAAGLVCGNGVCGAACTQAEEGQSANCGSGLICCSLHCTDIAINSDHCGACGTDCGSGEFCGIDACADGQGGAGGASAAPCVACHPTTLANICSIAKAVVILDTTKNEGDGNRVPGRAIGAALEAKCSPTPALSEAEQDSVEALNFTTGRPVSGGRELLVVAGGPFYQNLEGYVEEQGIAPLYLFFDDTNTEFRKRADDSPVASLAIAGDHDSHDFFLIQFMRDATSGSLVLNAQGFWLSGTVAAAFQLKEGMLPTLNTFDKAWYVYEWTDMNDDKLPDLNEITLKASGP